MRQPLKIVRRRESGRAFETAVSEDRRPVVEMNIAQRGVKPPSQFMALSFGRIIDQRIANIFYQRLGDLHLRGCQKRDLRHASAG